MFRPVNKKKDQGDEDTEKDARGDRQVHFEIATVNHDISWQFSKKWHFDGKMQNRACNKHNKPRNH
jgi:hypothetical protein